MPYAFSAYNVVSRHYWRVAHQDGGDGGISWAYRYLLTTAGISAFALGGEQAARHIIRAHLPVRGDSAWPVINGARQYSFMRCLLATLHSSAPALHTPAATPTSFHHASTTSTITVIGHCAAGLALAFHNAGYHPTQNWLRCLAGTTFPHLNGVLVRAGRTDHYLPQRAATCLSCDAMDVGGSPSSSHHSWASSHTWRTFPALHIAAAHCTPTRAFQQVSAYSTYTAFCAASRVCLPPATACTCSTPAAAPPPPSIGCAAPCTSIDKCVTSYLVAATAPPRRIIATSPTSTKRISFSRTPP